ncbi:MAG: glycoside hydrolase, partial [Bacteroidota bacterium]
QERLFEQQQQLLRRIIPSYRSMAQRGQIELITSAYYHPILPLLCDTEVARESRSDIRLPPRFSHREDAVRQVRRGLEYFQSHFAFQPKGFWPPEQSVSEAAAGLLAEHGLSWIVSDEGILARSLARPLERDSSGGLLAPETLYQPYWLDTPGGRIALLFRDIVLSDLIGFSYSRLSGQQAARDLVHRLQLAADRLPSGREYLVTIALDGENCWEYYPRDGHDFLQALYSMISEDPDLEMTTVSDYLQSHPPQRVLPRLHPGSWIYSDFSTWIGDPVKNRAWDYLKRVREDLVRHEQSMEPWDRELAWDEIAIAEGSDWFWWFGEGHSSGQDEAFDEQFRLHLQTVYHFAGLPVPDFLQEPVSRSSPKPMSVPRIFWKPALDGRSARGWEQAGTLDAAGQKGTMHQALRIIQKLHHAHDALHLYLRLEFTPFFQRDPEDEVLVYLCYPGIERMNSPINLRPGTAELGSVKGYLFAHELRIGLAPLSLVLSTAGECFTWHELGPVGKVAFEQALDLVIPFQALGLPPGQEIQFAIFFARKGTVAEVIPLDSLLGLTFPLSGVKAG